MRGRPRQRNDGKIVGAAVGDVERLLIGRKRQIVRARAGVARRGDRERARRRDRVDLFDHRIRGRADRRDPVAVVLRHVEHGLRRIQQQIIRVTGHRYASDQRGGRAREREHVDFAVTQRGRVNGVAAEEGDAIGPLAARDAAAARRRRVVRA